MLSHKQILELHDSAFSYNTETREKAANDMVFNWVTQWDDDSLNGSDLKYRGEFNILRKAMRQIMTDLTINEVQADFEPDDETSDDDANFMDKAYRANTRNNSAQEAKKNANQEAVVCGVGAWKWCNEYKNPWDKRQSLIRKPIFEANNTVFWDPNARLIDKSDANWCSIIEPYSEKSHEELLERLNKEDGGNYDSPVSDLSFPWISANGTRYVGEFYHREEVEKVTYVYEDGFGQQVRIDADDIEEKEDFLVDNDFELVDEEKSKDYRITRYLVDGKQILEEAVIPGCHIPIVPQYGERAYVEGIEHYEGITRLAKDPQRLRNFQLSYLADIVSRSPRKKPVFSDAQVAGYEDMLEDNGPDNNYPYVKLNHMDDNGEPLPIGPIGHLENADVPPALAQSIMESRAAVDDVASVGLTPDIAETDLSGKAIHALQKRLDMQSYTYQDNHKYAIRRDAEIFASMYSDIMDEEQEVTVVDIDGTRSKEKINVHQYNFEKGAMEIGRDVKRMKFSVYADIGPAFESVREQQREQLKELVMNTPPGTPQYNMLLNKFLSLTPGAGFEDIRDYSNMQLVLMGVRKPQTPEEEQAYMQAQQQAGQPDAQTQALLMEGQARMMEGQAAIQNEQNDAAKIAIDQFKAETDREYKRQQLIIDAQKAGADISNKQADTANKMIEARMRALGYS